MGETAAQGGTQWLICQRVQRQLTLTGLTRDSWLGVESKVSPSDGWETRIDGGDRVGEMERKRAVSSESGENDGGQRILKWGGW
jgi:hypothetical protein